MCNDFVPPVLTSFPVICQENSFLRDRRRSANKRHIETNSEGVAEKVSFILPARPGVPSSTRKLLPSCYKLKLENERMYNHDKDLIPDEQHTTVVASFLRSNHQYPWHQGRDSPYHQDHIFIYQQNKKAIYYFSGNSFGSVHFFYEDFPLSRFHSDDQSCK